MQAWAGTSWEVHSLLPRHKKCLTWRWCCTCFMPLKLRNCTANWTGLAKTASQDGIRTPVVSCTTLTEMQLKRRKARCCQSERFTSATYGTLTWARQQLLEKLDSPIFLNWYETLADLETHWASGIPRDSLGPIYKSFLPCSIEIAQSPQTIS